MNTFKIAGVSKANGQVKVRFANDMTRIKMLIKAGHTNIELFELPTAMEKTDVVKHLMTLDALMANPVYREVIEAANEKYNGVTKVTKAPNMDELISRAKSVTE